MKTPSKQAVAAFSQGLNCAQAVLTAHAESLGLSRDIALRLAAPFGGGMACLGETCGTISAALMILGLKVANADPNNAADKKFTNELTRRFINEFKKRHHATRCRELLGCDISTDEGMKNATDANLFATRCPALVKDAAEILEQLLPTLSAPKTSAKPATLSPPTP